MVGSPSSMCGFDTNLGVMKSSWASYNLFSACMYCASSSPSLVRWAFEHRQRYTWADTEQLGWVDHQLPHKSDFDNNVSLFRCEISDLMDQKILSFLCGSNATFEHFDTVLRGLRPYVWEVMVSNPPLHEQSPSSKLAEWDIQRRDRI